MAQVFAKKVYSYTQQQKLTRPIILLSLGIGDGCRTYEKIMFCRALGIKNLQLIGVEYDTKLAQKAKTMFPKAEIITQDLLAWDEENSIFAQYKGKIDFIEASFLFHEIYSFGGRTSSRATINDKLGRKEVFSLLSKCNSLLRSKGKIVILDGYLLPDGENLIEIKLSPFYRELYNYLQCNYEAISLPRRASDTIQLTRQQLAIILDKLLFFTGYHRRAISSERLAREMQEQLAFWNEKEWIQILEQNGLNIEWIGQYTFGIFLGQNQANIEVVHGEDIELPQPYQLLIASKQEHKIDKPVRDPITILKPTIITPIVSLPNGKLQMAQVVTAGWENIIETSYQTIIFRQGQNIQNLRVGFDGYSGSGKTEIANKIRSHLNKMGYSVALLKTDWFLKEKDTCDKIFQKVLSSKKPWKGSLSEFYELNEYAQLLEQIDDFIKGSAERLKLELKNIYNRETGKRDTQKTIVIDRNTIIFVEGIGSLKSA